MYIYICTYCIFNISYNNNNKPAQLASPQYASSSLGDIFSFLR